MGLTRVSSPPSGPDLARARRWVTASLIAAAVLALLILANSIGDYLYVSRLLTARQVRETLSQHVVALEQTLRRTPTPGLSLLEQLADAGVGGLRRRALVEAPRLDLGRACLLPHRLQAERSRQPHVAAFDEAAHVLPPDQWNVLAEFLFVEFKQSPSVVAFFVAHLLEDRGRGRELLPQAFGVVGVDALVFFFEGDGQRQDLAFGKAVESSHDARSVAAPVTSSQPPRAGLR